MEAHAKISCRHTTQENITAALQSLHLPHELMADTRVHMQRTSDTPHCQYPVLCRRTWPIQLPEVLAILVMTHACSLVKNDHNWSPTTQDPELLGPSGKEELWAAAAVTDVEAGIGEDASSAGGVLPIQRSMSYASTWDLCSSHAHGLDDIGTTLPQHA
jgi:hypothetical protein